MYRTIPTILAIALALTLNTGTRAQDEKKTETKTDVKKVKLGETTFEIKSDKELVSDWQSVTSNEKFEIDAEEQTLTLKATKDTEIYWKANNVAAFVNGKPAYVTKDRLGYSHFEYTEAGDEVTLKWMKADEFKAWEIEKVLNQTGILYWGHVTIVGFETKEALDNPKVTVKGNELTLEMNAWNKAVVLVNVTKAKSEGNLKLEVDGKVKKELTLKHGTEEKLLLPRGEFKLTLKATGPGKP